MGQSLRDRLAVERRTVALLLGLTLFAVPALLLRAFCVGRACDQAAPRAATVPFCSLPEPTRSLIAAGYRDGRSPDVLAVTDSVPVLGGTDLSGRAGVAPPWPSIAQGDPTRVPLVFSGNRVQQAHIPDGVTLDAVAPTVARIIDLRRPHPNVRSGGVIPEVIREASKDAAPRLILEIVWLGVGSRDLERAPRAWPVLADLIDRGGSTLDAQVGSLPLDPAAVLTTLGTGGLPDQHGIIGTFVRNEEGNVVRAWSRRAPPSVIAGLGDDLDEILRQEPRIGIIGTDISDRGAIGGTWYLEGDEDDVVIGRGGAAGQVAAAADLLAAGYGADDVPDLLVVVMRGAIPRLDGALGALLVRAAEASEGALTTVVTAAGHARTETRRSMLAEHVRRSVERSIASPLDVVSVVALGGLFLDQRALGSLGLAESRIIEVLRRLPAPDGTRLFADAFSSFAVSLARFCP